MLYVIYGSDREKGRKEFRALREKFIQKGLSLEIVKESSVSRELFERIGSTRDLFAERSVIVFDNILEKKEEQDVFMQYAEHLASSQNEIIIFEPSLTSATIQPIKEHTTVCVECVFSEKENRSKFNIFALGDALGDRNKKELWMLYRQAVEEGVSSEEISNTLFWTLKNIALIQNAKPGDNAGLNSFVAQKTRRFAKNYTSEELKKYSKELVRGYHRAHLGEGDMEVSLERFILTI